MAEEKNTREQQNEGFTFEAPASPAEAPEPETVSPEDYLPRPERPESEQELDLSKSEGHKIRLKRIRLLKRRRMVFAAGAALALVLIVVIVLLIVGAIRRGRDSEFSQIGPFPPGEEIQVERRKDPYDYSSFVPESDSKNEDWFEDALIIGDFRVEGFSLYEMTGAQLLYSSSCTVETAVTSQLNSSSGGTARLSDLLAANDYGKIYLVFGLSEMGWQYEAVFIQYYQNLIDLITEAEPDADIYLQSILPISASAASSHSYITAAKTVSYNARILALAAENELYCLNVPDLLGADGVLKEEYAEANGIGITKSGYAVWYNYLLTHTVNREDYL